VRPLASSPPHEPSELLHVEGRAAAEGIDGGGLELGLGDGSGLVVEDWGKNPREEKAALKVAKDFLGERVHGKGARVARTQAPGCKRSGFGRRKVMTMRSHLAAGAEGRRRRGSATGPLVGCRMLGCTAELGRGKQPATQQGWVARKLSRRIRGSPADFANGLKQKKRKER
jgi:hypothetical protein